MKALREREEVALAAAADGRETGASADTLGLILDEIEAGLHIAEAQLDLDAARGREAVDSAMQRQIESYRALARVLVDRARQSADGRGVTVAASINALAATATERLRQFRVLSDEVTDSLRAGVLASLDDLDRAAARVASTNDR